MLALHAFFPFLDPFAIFPISTLLLCLWCLRLRCRCRCCECRSKKKEGFWFHFVYGMNYDSIWAWAGSGSASDGLALGSMTKGNLVTSFGFLTSL